MTWWGGTVGLVISSWLLGLTCSESYLIFRYYSFISSIFLFFLPIFCFWLGKFRPENAHNLIYQNCFIVSFVMIYYIGKIISLNGARDSWV